MNSSIKENNGVNVNGQDQSILQNTFLMGNTLKEMNVVKGNVEDLTVFPTVTRTLSSRDITDT